MGGGGGGGSDSERVTRLPAESDSLIGVVNSGGRRRRR